MLPFSKRPPRPGQLESAELISTDEIEVVNSPASTRKVQSRFPGPPSERPRVFQRSLSDEDRTLLMPAKPKTSSAPPFPALPTPASVRPVPSPNLRGLVRPRVDEERTILRPSAPPLVASPSHAPVATAPSMLPTPYMPFKPPAPPPLPTRTGPSVATPLPPLPISPVLPKMQPQAAKHSDSDPRIDPPAAVITARTHVTTALRKPNLSWAAALMAAGVFVGLVTAVLARGDGDALIDATAAFVDPSSHGSHAAGVAAPNAADAVVATDAKSRTTAAAATGACLDPTAKPVSLPVVNTPPPQRAEPAQLVASHVADEPVGRPEPPKPAPIAYAAPLAPAPVAAPKPVHAAPQHWSAPSYNAPAAPKPVQVAAAARPARPTPSPAVARAGSEMDSATAADALAKAQLEASLR